MAAISIGREQEPEVTPSSSQQAVSSPEERDASFFERSVAKYIARNIAVLIVVYGPRVGLVLF